MLTRNVVYAYDLNSGDLPPPFNWIERKFPFRGISSTRIDVRRANDSAVIVGARLKNFNGRRFASRYGFIVYFCPDGISP